MSSDNTAFDIQEYMTKGVVRVVTDSIHATARNPREALFMSSFAIASSAASKKRAGLEKKGCFLIHISEAAHFTRTKILSRR